MTSNPKPDSLYENNRAFDAYYYSFGITKCYPVDVVLHAVAKAGKAYHNTSEWGEQCEPWTVHLKGDCPIDWIWNAADAAAEQFRQLAGQRDDLMAALKDALAFCEANTFGGDDTAALIAKARAALAKATGSTL